jgi:hypothetical protein
VHRKRSQVAVIDQGGEVLVNRNVPNGAGPILKGRQPRASSKINLSRPRRARITD